MEGFLGLIVGAINGYVYRAVLSAVRQAEDYTARIIAYHAEAITPLETAHILWQR